MTPSKKALEAKKKRDVCERVVRGLVDNIGMIMALAMIYEAGKVRARGHELSCKETEQNVGVAKEGAFHALLPIIFEALTNIDACMAGEGAESGEWSRHKCPDCNYQWSTPPNPLPTAHPSNEAIATALVEKYGTETDLAAQFVLDLLAPNRKGTIANLTAALAELMKDEVGK